MKKSVKVLSALFAVCMMYGCAAGVAPVTGYVFSEVSGPVVATTSTGSSKTGSATCESILGWVALGDCSIMTAKNNGNITNVSSVDYKTISILGLYAKVTTVVKGQ
jgi:hypothetical protein